MIIPVDIQNSNRKSGYNHVLLCEGKKPYIARAYGGDLDKAGRSWQGPRRARAIDAAWDFCKYATGAGIAVVPLKSAGHNGKRDSLPRDAEVEAALGVLRDAKAQRDGEQGYVYLVIEEHPGGALKFAKVGYSTNPRARVAELQTGNPRPLSLHLMKEGTLEDEAAIHQRHIRSNVLAEWFRITPELLLEWDNEHYVKGEETA